MAAITTPGTVTQATITPALVIEVHQGARHDSRFHRVEAFPFRIGRAYDNDLILVDDTVSPHHLQLESHEDGIYVRNLSDENGTWCAQRQLGTEAEALPAERFSPLALTLGRTHIKILTSNTAVAPTRNFPHSSKLTRWASDLRVAIALLAVYLFLSIFFALERQSVWFNWEEVLVNQLLEIVLPLVAATVIGFVSRILLHRWRFALQLSIACIALGILTFSGEITAVISYWLTDDVIADYLLTFFMGVCFIGLLAWQLRAVSTLSRKRATWTSVAIVVPLFLIWELQAIINQPEFQTAAPMHTLLKPGDVRVAKSLESIEVLRQQVEQELQQGLTEELQAGKEQGDSNS